MNPMQRAVLDFHRKFDVPHPPSPNIRPDKEGLLRVRLVFEEATELATAISTRNLPDIADALADLLYVTFGTAVQYGINIQPIFADVHRANMSKIQEKDQGGKIRKGLDFVPPDSRPLLVAQGVPMIRCWAEGCLEQVSNEGDYCGAAYCSGGAKPYPENDQIKIHFDSGDNPKAKPEATPVYQSALYKASEARE